MKKNLKKALIYFNGEPLTEKVNNKDVPCLICNVLGKALFDVSVSANLTADEKYRAFKISQRIAAKPEAVELESDEIMLIRRVIAPSFSAGIYGQIVDVLEKDK